MLKVFPIVAGAAFTVGTCIAAGSLLLRRMRISLYRQEALLLSFLCGSACCSLAVFVLSLLQLARRNVFLVGGAAVMIWAWRRAWPQLPRKSLPSLPRAWNLLFCSLLTAFGLVYFFNALAPEASPDGGGYHLGNVLRMWEHHGFVWSYHSLYSYLSQGVEMLFLVAFSIGLYSAASLVHFTFLMSLPLLIAAYGRRFGFPGAALFAAILVYVAPVAAKAGVSAYNDLAVAAVVFAIFYLLEIWDESRERNLLILIGLLAGFGFAIKYTAVLALPFAWARVLWRRGSWRQMGVLTGSAAILIVPWLLRDWIWVGNPVAPFFNRWFPNPYFHPGMERIYLEELKHYVGLRHWWEVPWGLAVGGNATQGTIGPVFLLLPLALLAWQKPRGRWLLLAGLVFAIPAYFNTGARFLIPSLPFLALALGLALAKIPPILPVLALCEAMACWPAVLTLYNDPLSWRVHAVPLKAALRKEPEAEYLKNQLRDYDLKGALETLVPAKARIFSLGSRSEAYLDRTFVVGYESALGNLLQDLFAAVMDARARPAVRRRLRFLPVHTRALRVVQEVPGNAFWTVTEMRVYAHGRELTRAPNWRLTAWPNGWDVQLAFDNSYATRWSSWQAQAPGMFLAIDFGESQVVDEVDLEEVRSPESKVVVEVLRGDASWVPLTDTAQMSRLDVPSGLRRAVSRELKAHGIRYLWVEDTDFFADDLQKYPSYWSVTELHAARGRRLYFIN
jgi:hypothetical protein